MAPSAAPQGPSQCYTWRACQILTVCSPRQSPQVERLRIMVHGLPPEPEADQKEDNPLAVSVIGTLLLRLACDPQTKSPPLSGKTGAQGEAQ